MGNLLKIGIVRFFDMLGHPDVVRAPVPVRQISLLGDFLGDVLREISGEPSGAVTRPPAVVPLAQVDVAVAHHPKPKGTEQVDGLPTADGKVPMAGAPLLPLEHRDIRKVAAQSTADEPEEPREILLALSSVGLVLSIRQRQHMIQAGGLDQAPDHGTGSAGVTFEIFDFLDSTPLRRLRVGGWGATPAGALGRH